MNNYTCQKCKKEKQGWDVPYLWSSIHEEASDVHDSDCVVHKYDYHLCPDCRIDPKP